MKKIILILVLIFLPVIAVADEFDFYKAALSSDLLGSALIAGDCPKIYTSSEHDKFEKQRIDALHWCPNV